MFRKDEELAKTLWNRKVNLGNGKKTFGERYTKAYNKQDSNLLEELTYIFEDNYTREMGKNKSKANVITQQPSNTSKNDAYTSQPTRTAVVSQEQQSSSAKKKEEQAPTIINNNYNTTNNNVTQASPQQRSPQLIVNPAPSYLGQPTAR
jgi:hypothetical protein